MTSRMNDRPGSMSLRSNGMNYSRAVLTGNWHQARESEPKDYNLCTAPVRNLYMSTYRQLSHPVIISPSHFKSTYQEQFVPRTRDTSECRPMTTDSVRQIRIDRDHTISLSDLQRETGRHRASEVILPKFKGKDGRKIYETTYFAGYGRTLSDEETREAILRQQLKEAEEARLTRILSASLRKCKSQFTDTCDYKRVGRNTWQDESGVYANQTVRSGLPQYQRTKTLQVI